VHAALRLGDGHALHAVHAALELQAGPHAVAALGRALGAHRDGGVLDAAEVGRHHLEGLDGPAHALEEPQVHAHEVPGEQAGLLAARAGLDLDDDVFRVIGVARDQQLGELGLQLGDALADALGFLREVRVLLRELFSGLEVVLGGRDVRCGLRDRRELGVAPSDPPGLGLVGMQRGVAHLDLEVLELGEQGFQAVVGSGGHLNVL
jgi:hypothetical protein